MILSKETLHSLGIVVINEYPDALPKEVIPIQRKSRILLPYDQGKLVMNIDGTKPIQSTAGVTKESLVHDFKDVYQARSTPMPAKKFKIELESNAKPC